MIRKTVLTTAIVGAGLASTAGAAFAGDAPCDDGGSGHHHSHSSSSSSNDCTNDFAGAQQAEGKGLVGSALNNAQGALGANVCHNLNNNKILADNSIKVLNLDL